MPGPERVQDNIKTREFRVEDYDAALALWRRLEGLEIAEGDEQPEIAQFLEENRGLSRVALAGETLAGVALCGHDHRRGHIYHLAVAPEFQRHGIGKRLVNECLDGLRQAGLRRAIILVAGDNACGQQFWLRQGWEEVSGAVAMGIDL